jgi:hypothetical protein
VWVESSPAEMLNSKIAVAICLSIVPAVGRINPCVVSIFFAVVVLVVSVLMPVPSMCSSMGLLMVSKGLLVIVFLSLALVAVGSVGLVEPINAMLLGVDWVGFAFLKRGRRCEARC